MASPPVESLESQPVSPSWAFGAGTIIDPHILTRKPQFPSDTFLHQIGPGYASLFAHRFHLAGYRVAIPLHNLATYRTQLTEHAYLQQIQAGFPLEPTLAIYLRAGARITSLRSDCDPPQAILQWTRK